VLAALAVDSKTGGDAGRTLDGMEGELRRQQRVRRESRSLAAQARLSARLVLFGLTPASVLVLLIFNPFGAAHQFTQPIGAIALVVGIFVQIAGVAFIEMIAAAPARQLNVPAPPVLPNWPGATNVARPVQHGWRLSRFVKALAPQTYGKTVKTTTLISVADVMASAIESGATPVQGLEAAAPLVPAELGGALRRAVLEARAGMPLVAALQETTAPLDDDDVDALVALIERSERLGVPLADALRRLADDLHEVQETSANEDARRASVWSMLPLTVVVIPGFLLTTLVPVLFAVLSRIADLAHGLQ
jgi:Flp pilus assembly protein TadB